MPFKGLKNYDYNSLTVFGLIIKLTVHESVKKNDDSMTTEEYCYWWSFPVHFICRRRIISPPWICQVTVFVLGAFLRVFWSTWLNCFGLRLPRTITILRLRKAIQLDDYTLESEEREQLCMDGQLIPLRQAKFKHEEVGSHFASNGVLYTRLKARKFDWCSLRSYDGSQNPKKSDRQTKVKQYSIPGLTLGFIPTRERCDEI